MVTRRPYIVGPVYVNRHAYHCPGRETCQPEGFDTIALWITEVETDSARMGDEPVNLVSLLDGSAFEVSNVVQRLDP